MTRQQLEHLIRACAATADVRELVVIGSQRESALAWLGTLCD